MSETETGYNPEIVNSKLERKENVATITNPEGIYSIMYGGHQVSRSPKEIPNNLSSIFLETGGNNWSEDKIDDCIDGVVNSSGRHPTKSIYLSTKEVGKEEINPTYLKKIEDMGIPIYFTDPHLETDKFNKEYESKSNHVNFISALEGLLGSGILIKTVSDIIKDKVDQPISRRTFLKGAIQGIAAAWLASSNLPRLHFLESAYEKGADRDTATELMKKIQSIHPEIDYELASCIVRNTVIAYKARWKMEQGHDQNVGISIGAAHYGLEDIIQNKSQEQKLEFLRQMKLYIKDNFSPETFYGIARIDFNGSRWVLGKIDHIPELKSILE